MPVQPSSAPRPLLGVALSSGAVVMIAGLLAWSLDAPALAPPWQPVD